MVFPSLFSFSYHETRVSNSIQSSKLFFVAHTTIYLATLSIDDDRFCKIIFGQC